MAVYEFENKEKYENYQASKEKERLIEDYRLNFSETSQLKRSSWEQCYP